MLPCVVYEDGELLVVNKPAGLNTHAPSPFAGEGIYEWLRHREARWATLAIIHRLDKETSGLLVFGKTSAANRSLTQQFTNRAVAKEYLLLTDRRVPGGEHSRRTRLVREGERYVSRPGAAGAEIAETRFRLASREAGAGERQGQADATAGMVAVLAEPLTGRTHQIRVHAADLGFPILGDALYGGTPAARVYLHATKLSFKHPTTGRLMSFAAAPEFGANPRLVLRQGLVDEALTSAWRVLHGASDGRPGWYVERLGEFLFSQGAEELSPEQKCELGHLMSALGARGAYHKRLRRQVQKTSIAEASPSLALGEAAPERFTIRENGLAFELSFAEGYSTGLFLDQRDNRRRWLTGYVAAGFSLASARGAEKKMEVLNTFAYTCAFSVCAAKAGARTTSLDLSRKYLEWGKRNFVLNQLDPGEHDFIYGDAFEWLKRLTKRGRRFHAVLLDPPTFSRSKDGGVFRAEKDYGRLVKAAVPLLNPGALLFASSNAGQWPPEDFLAAIERPVAECGRRILRRHYVPQPPDFPISRSEPGYLKTVWLQLD